MKMLESEQDNTFGPILKKLTDQEKIAIAKISYELMEGCRGYFQRRGFVDVSPQVPRITKATGSCENLDTTFPLRFFDKSAYLAQTEQLYLETLIPFFKKVCCYGPSSRAEDRVDTRHVCEFYLIEFEEAQESTKEKLFEQLLTDIEGVIQAMVSRVFRTAREDLEVLGVNEELLKLAYEPFQRITYSEAIRQLDLPWCTDLKSGDEERIVKSLGNRPVFVTHFPREIKFFNMRDNDSDPRVVNSADLLLPFSGEAVGAAERESDYLKIEHKLLGSRMFGQLEQKGGGINDFEYFLEGLRKRGGIPHAGCGIGFNRIVQYVCQLPDIRLTTWFPIYRGSIF
jgi:asparaginyl-tRNA synthetase